MVDRMESISVRDSPGTKLGLRGKLCLDKITVIQIAASTILFGISAYLHYLSIKWNRRLVFHHKSLLSEMVLINSGSVAWQQENATYIFPYDHAQDPPWCPFWLENEGYTLLNQSRAVPLLREESYSMTMNKSSLENILLNWNESYSFSPFDLTSKFITIPERNCFDLRSNNAFAWENNSLILSDTFMAEVEQNATRGSQKRYTNLVLLGTSETRNLFAQLCKLQNNTVNVTKTTMQEKCGSVEFFNMCSIGCGCNFGLAVQKLSVRNGSTIISASCGLHGEYLLSSAGWRDLLEGLSQWASEYSSRSGNLFQFRTSNAINPLKTKPAHLVLARNNVRSKYWAYVAIQSFYKNNLALFDVYRYTEPLFWKSSDHVHFHGDGGAVYASLAKLFNSVIPLETI